MDENKMDQQREGKILEDDIARWGDDRIMCKAGSALGELYSSLCSHQLTRKVSDKEVLRKIAEVSIRLNELELIFGDPTEYEIARLNLIETANEDYSHVCNMEAVPNED